MNTKKKTILAAAFVVAIIALAGVGYAAFSTSYKGTTTSATNDFDVDYVVISLDNPAYTAKTENLYVMYDTITNASGSTFYWLGSSVISHTVTVTIPTADTAVTDDPDTYRITATIANSPAIPEGYGVQYKVGNDGEWTLVNGEIVLQDSTTNISSWSSGKAVQWRFIPLTENDEAVSTAAHGGDDGVEVTFENFVPGSTLQLPAITYTVTAQQQAE